MKKKKKSNKGQSEELQGFSDLFESINKGPAKTSPKERVEDFSIFSLLEHESMRLNKCVKFFEFKLPNFINFNQHDRLLEMQDFETEEAEQTVIDIIDQDESFFNQNLSRMFNSAFSEY